jgi:hypothetical protein
MGDMRNVQIFVEKPQGKRLFWRSRGRMDDNIKYILEKQCTNLLNFGLDSAG